MYGVIVTKLPDEGWGYPSVARAIPNAHDVWGSLAFLKGTVWEGLFPLIGNTVFEQALRGHATPLMRIIGPPPKAFVKRLPVENGMCRNRNTCINASDKCIPSPQVPPCWEASGFSEGEVSTVNYVVQLWREGIPVVILNEQR